MSTKFARHRSPQTTPKVCKKQPTGWAFVPGLPMPLIYGSILWKGHVEGTPPTEPRDFFHFDEFTMTYSELFNDYRYEIDHDPDHFRLELDITPDGQPCLLDCRFWIPPRIPIQDNFHAPDLTGLAIWSTMKDYEDTPDPEDYRLYILHT